VCCQKLQKLQSARSSLQLLKDSELGTYCWQRTPPFAKDEEDYPPGTTPRMEGRQERSRNVWTQCLGLW